MEVHSRYTDLKGSICWFFCVIGSQGRPEFNELIYECKGKGGKQCQAEIIKAAHRC